KSPDATPWARLRARGARPSGQWPLISLREHYALVAFGVFCRQPKSSTARQTTAHSSMKPRFEPNPDAASTREAQRLIDPEAFEASEQQFEASLESMELLSAARVVVDVSPG